MTESNKNIIPEKESEKAEQTTSPPLYPEPYCIDRGCLCLRRIMKGGEVIIPLCNFIPRIFSEITYDNGAEQSKQYRIGGTDENGCVLRTVDVAATELESMTWIDDNWPASCSLNVVSSVEKHVRRAIKGTATQAQQRFVFAHTGWIFRDGMYTFLLPGNGKYEVQLHGKQCGYMSANSCEDIDLAYLSGFLQLDFIPHEVLYPCLALVFLSPLNSFMKRAGCEPKFILTLSGRTGSMKSTVAALMLSFFGRFTATDLPMSFRDTANSIIHNAFALRDVLTCVDDYHPVARRESDTMKAIMQTLARGYGDRAGRSRLTSDITLRDSHPPQGNVIVTAEYAPDIGESGTARLFCIDMRPGELDLLLLSEVQEKAADGMLMRCMNAYLTWLKDSFLSSEEHAEVFVSEIAKRYEALRSEWRSKLRDRGLAFHARIPDTLACLSFGFTMLLRFIKSHFMLKADNEDVCESDFSEILLSLAAKQANAVTQDKPTHIYICKLLAMIDSGTLTLADKDNAATVSSGNIIGYEDNEYYYIFFETSLRAVMKFCSDQNQSFAISTKALGKALQEEGLIVPVNGKSTDSMSFGGRKRRVMILRKEAAQKIADDNA